jgi:hypothetical protein
VDVPVNAISGNRDLGLNQIALGQKPYFLFVEFGAVVIKGFLMAPNADYVI